MTEATDATTAEPLPVLVRKPGAFAVFTDRRSFGWDAVFETEAEAEAHIADLDPNVDEVAFIIPIAGFFQPPGY